MTLHGGIGVRRHVVAAGKDATVIVAQKQTRALFALKAGDGTIPALAFAWLAVFIGTT
jgi:hypothetical protein